MRPGKMRPSIFSQRHQSQAARPVSTRLNSRSILSFAMLSVSFMVTSPRLSAETIYYGGNILNGVGLPGDNPQRVTAMAVDRGQILAVGDDASILQSKGEHTVLVNLHGAFVMPGINDAHVHLAEAGRRKLSVDLEGSTSLGQMLDRVRLAAAAAPHGQWLLGGGWDHTLWPEKTLPSRWDLDTVTGQHPAIFSRVDGHISVANSAALAAAGITPQTPDPPGGHIDRNGSGEATGILREDPSEELVWKHIPPPSHALRTRALSLALADAVANGVTSVQDNSDWEDFLVYEELERDGKLPVRVSEWLRFDDPVETLKAHRAWHPAGDRMLRTGMLKGFLDGSLGSRTAALKAPYTDDPGNSGILRYEQARLDEMTAQRAEAGFQIGFHAIGDRAVAAALEAFERARQAVGTPANAARFAQARNRIEHSQVVDPPDIERYRETGILASMQPNHLLTDMSWARARLGPQREQFAYAWKAFLDAGVVVAFGTDYPVEPVNPFRGLYCAVTRENESGTDSYFPEKKLTIGQALYAYTQGSAYAEFSENYKGKLIPGYVADFVVLDRDLTKVTPKEILATRVLQTVVDGRTVYRAGARSLTQSQTRKPGVTQ